VRQEIGGTSHEIAILSDSQQFERGRGPADNILELLVAGEGGGACRGLVVGGGRRASRLTQVPSFWTSISAEVGCVGHQGIKGQNKKRDATLAGIARAPLSTPPPRHRSQGRPQSLSTCQRLRAPFSNKHPKAEEIEPTPLPRMGTAVGRHLK
jgi:hypothetical protein